MPLDQPVPVPCPCRSRRCRSGFAARTAAGRGAAVALLAVLGGAFVFTPGVQAQEGARARVPVEVDGNVLFYVGGIEARPAPERAQDIKSSIETLAEDPSFAPDSIHVEDRGVATFILGGSTVIMGVSDEEARAEGVQRPLLAPVFAARIARAIAEYRDSRTRTHLAEDAGRALAAFVIAGLILFILLLVLRSGEQRLHDLFNRRVAALGSESRRILQVEQVWRTARGTLALVRTAVVLSLTVFLLQYVLVQFPWTRRAGMRLINVVWQPLAAFGDRFVAAIPSLVLLAILFAITRYVLSLARVYFDSLQSGNVRLHDFEPEWALPTYNLVRIGVVAFALVIAYPLIPGSDSEAFKGLSLLAGLMLSFGSSAAIANLVAGYMIIYRRSFSVGDRVKIGDVVGVVSEMRMQVTHIRTLANEEITIPNSSLLGTEVTNYSRPAREGRLIIFTEVGIGYETPWRQVEAMLVDAAHRTAGLLQQPAPFVLPMKLGDFAVVYRINVYCGKPDGHFIIAGELHRHILDVFNEHGVQIMTPVYEGDPAIPKVVPPDQWWTPPAHREVS